MPLKPINLIQAAALDLRPAQIEKLERNAKGAYLDILANREQCDKVVKRD
jgi:hypothetical protein